MALNLFLILIPMCALSAAQSDVLNSTDAQTCADLCKSCNGVAKYVDGRCECNIEQSVDEGAECVLRMKREATEHGLDVFSCDLSDDKRFTRCLLGSKLEGNDIDQVAKYFMQDGPITGSIFLAPPYTHTSPPDTVKSPKTDCADQPSLFILNPVQDTTNRPATILASPRNQQTISIPQHQQLIVSSPQSPHIVSGSFSPLIVSSPQSHHVLPSSNNENVGAPRIITQPKETMVAPKINLTPRPHADLRLGKTATNTNSPIVGDINPNLLKDQNNTSNFFRLLGQQLSQPMFGIPQAIQTVSETPGFNQWVSAPVNLIYTFLQRLNENANQVGSTRKASGPTNVKVGIPKIVLSNPNANSISPIVGAQFPTFNYNYPSLGSPVVSLLNPTMNVPATAQVSYVPQMTAAMQPAIQSTVQQAVPAGMPVIHSPIVGSISPYNSFVPQVPTFVVGAPLGLPYYTNYNTGAVPGTSLNMVGSSEESPVSYVEHKVDPPSEENVGSSFLQTLKKICKKSTMEETPVKKARDIKNIPESVIDEIRFQEMKKHWEEIERQKNVEQDLTNIPRMFRTTTQAPVIDTKTNLNNNLKTKLKEHEKLEKPIMEQRKLEKENKIKNKPIIEFMKKPRDKKGTQ